MEYLVVEFGTIRRRVRVNGNPSGFTGDLLQLEAGTHLIALEPPADFDPPEQTILLKDTSALVPKRVTFVLRPPSPPPPASGTRA
jgi:hypothetical protein